MTDIGSEELKEFYNKGVLAFEKQNYDYAIELFSQIISSKYDHIEARHYLHLSLKNKIGNAKPSFIAAIVNTIDREIAGLSSNALVKKGKIREALERIEKVITRSPCDAETLKMMADIFIKENLKSHAIQNLEEAKSINPGDAAVLKKLGELYLAKEDYKNAKANLEAVLKINPHDTDALRSLKNLDALGTIQREFGS